MDLICTIDYNHINYIWHYICSDDYIHILSGIIRYSDSMYRVWWIVVFTIQIKQMNEAIPTYAGNYSSICFVCNRIMQNADKRCHLCISCYVPTSLDVISVPTANNNRGSSVAEWENEGGAIKWKTIIFHLIYQFIIHHHNRWNWHY